MTSSPHSNAFGRPRRRGRRKNSWPSKRRRSLALISQVKAMALNADDKRKAQERRLMDQRGTLDLFNSEPKRRRPAFLSSRDSKTSEVGGGRGDQIRLTGLAHHLEGEEG